MSLDYKYAVRHCQYRDERGEFRTLSIMSTRAEADKFDDSREAV